MRDRVIGIATGLSCVLLFVILILILGDIFCNGIRVISWKFLTEYPEQGLTAGGIFPCIVGTCLMVMIMTIFCMPLGVITAIYMHEYAPRGSRILRIAEIAVQNLAGVPAMVYGLFGVGFFILTVGNSIDRVFYGGEIVMGRPCIFWASLTMSLLVMPTVIVTTLEALRAVPDGHREVGYALGATKWQVIWRIVLPQAIPGILTGGILAIGRAIGEVTPLLFTGVASYLAELPDSLSDRFMDVGYYVYILATQSPDIEKTKPLLYGTVFVIVALTIVLSIIPIIIRLRIRAKR
jgi:phosphate transport system permease protein